MNLRTYHAYSMAEALEAVKNDLGADAVILHTRTFRRGGVLGIGARNIVEVTASDALPSAEDGEHIPRKARSERVASVSATAADVLEAKRNGAATVSALQARRAYGDGKASRHQGIKASSGKVSGDRSIEGSSGGTESGGLAAGVPARAKPQHVHSPVVSVRAPVEEKMKAAPPARSIAPPPAAPEPVITHPVKKWVPEQLSKREAKLAEPSPTKPAVVRVPVQKIASSAAPAARSTPHPPPGPLVSAATLRPQREGEVARPRTQPTAQQGAPKSQSTPPAQSQQPTAQGPDLHDELAAIRDMVGQVLQRQTKSTGKAIPGVPQQLFDMYLTLISHDLAEEVADDVVSSVAKSLSPDKLDDDEAVRGAVLEALTKYIPAAESATLEFEKPGDGRPLTIALVGPTGVGKTTTLAKLAASYKLHQKRNVGLVTCDTYRIAAVDQLTTYAKIIGVPLRVARSPEEMRLAVGEFAGCDVVLIDTAGRGQRDSARLGELHEMIKAANPHEVHLVLSSTANEKVLLSEAEAFAPLGAEKIVLTKLDEAVSFGMLVNVLRTVGKRLSFVTTGQEVPDDFELGSAKRLAELVLGTKGDV